MFSVGQVVFSKCGRDKGLPFVIVSIQDEFLYLADGNMRKLFAPKKKKQKHVQPTNNILTSIKDSLENEIQDDKNNLLDVKIRKELLPYVRV